MTQGGPGFASEVPAKYVYDFMFQRANLGQGLAASTVMLRHRLHHPRSVGSRRVPPEAQPEEPDHGNCHLLPLLSLQSNHSAPRPKRMFAPSTIMLYGIARLSPRSTTCFRST